MSFVCFVGTFAVLLQFYAGIVHSLQARAWQSLDELVPNANFEYPEASILAGQPDRTSTGIGFTGGGSRSYIASFGYISAFHKLDKMGKVSYVSGISGGSWATSVYTYSQHNSADELEFLGEIVSPEDITREQLKIMSGKCARRLSDSKFTNIVLKSIDKCPSLGEMWCYGTQEAYLSPSGIPRDTYWAFTQEQIDDIIARNPELQGTPFLLPSNPNRPFPIIGSTLIGPEQGSPYTYKRDNQNYTFFEMTPLYVGHVKRLDMEYNTNKKRSNHVQKRTVGGFIETFAFSRAANTTDGTNVAPPVGLSGAATAILDVPSPSGIFDLGHASGASSFAPGAFFDSFTIEKPTSLRYNYYSPIDPTSGGQSLGSKKDSLFDTLFTDGGSLENIPLMSLLQRGVKRIVYCSNSATPLQPSSKWNIDAPDAMKLPNQIDSSISAFFGIYPPEDHKFQDRSYEYQRNQIFSTSDYPALVKDLQAAQSVGKGIIVRTTLTTVENRWWGVKGGIQADITFVILGRLSVWESLLSDEMRKLVVPEKNADDLAETIPKGPFKHFPHYPTEGGDINSEQANLLADLTGWSILQNQELFNDI